MKNASAGSGERWQGVLLIALSAIGFGAMAIFARLAYAGGADVTGVLLLRFAAAALILLALVRLRRLPWPPPRTLAWLAAMGGIGYVGMSWCYFTALNYAPASLVAMPTTSHDPARSASSRSARPGMVIVPSRSARSHVRQRR